MTPLLLCRFAQTASAVLLAGTLVLRLIARGTHLGEAPPQWDRLAAWSWGGVLVAGVLQLGLTAAAITGLSLAEAVSGEVLGRVLGGTRFGAVWLVRGGLLAALGLVLGFNNAISRSSRWVPTWGRTAGEVTGALLAGLTLVSLVWAGHAAASEHRGWLLPSDALHAVAAGVWPGGLLPLGMLLARARRVPALVGPALTITRRFSCLSVWAVGVLALTGLVNGGGLVGTLPALWEENYGRLVLTKGVLFVTLVWIGAMNRRALRRQASHRLPDATLLDRVWRNVAGECVLAGVVLLLSAGLAQSAPPAPSKATTANPLQRLCTLVPGEPGLRFGVFPHRVWRVPCYEGLTARCRLNISNVWTRAAACSTTGPG